MASLISFGSAHTHKVNGKLLHNNVLAKVRNRDHAFELFGNKWAFEYKEENLGQDKIKAYFPDGIIDLTNEGDK
jgi:hypothetical protein